MSGTPQHLTVTLEGGRADEHRVRVTDLAKLTKQIQAAVRSVAAVLSEQPILPNGRRTVDNAVKELTELEFVAQPKAGSFAVEIELAEAPGSIDGFLSLGSASLEALVDGLAQLDEETAIMPRGFDRGVLRDISQISTLFGPKAGYSKVNLSLNGAVQRRVAELQPAQIRAARNLIESPYEGPAVVEGVLQMLDHGAHPMECRVDRDPLPSVKCLIPQALRGVADEARRKRVRIEGLGSFPPDSNYPRKIQVETLTTLHPLLDVDSETYRLNLSWQEHVIDQGAAPVIDPSALEASDLFESDDDYESFQSAMRDI